MTLHAQTGGPSPRVAIAIVANAHDRTPVLAAIRELDSTAALVAPAVANLVLIPLHAPGPEAWALLERCTRETPAATLVALMPQPTRATIVAAMRAGAAEVLPLPLVPAALGALLAKLAALRAMGPSSATDAGQVVTVLAPKEGIGATTLVANLGIELARVLPHQVALVDLDLRNGDLALLLNVDPPQSLVDLAVGVESLDAVFVHGSLVRHATGLSLLAASTDRGPDASCLTPAHVTDVLALLRANHRIVLVDAPPPLSDTLLAAARAADRVLLPTEPTVPCLRAAWRTLEALAREGVAADAIDVVATRHGSDSVGLPLDAIAEALGHEVHHVVPREDATAFLALNGGLPVATVRSDGPLQRAIVGLAAALLALERNASQHTATPSTLL